MQVLKRRQGYTEREIQYHKYCFSVREYIFSGLFIIGLSGIYAYIFYKSIIAFFVLLCPSYFYIQFIKKQLIKRRLRTFNIQFKEFCLSLSAQLSAGYSLENALVEVYRELSQIYGERAYICVEIKNIILKIKLSITIEDGFYNMAERTGIEDIRLFAEVIRIAKKSGGDMIEIVKNTANSICRKIEVDREIRMIINGKKYEQSIMNVVPLVLVLYMEVSSTDIMEVMYHTVIGRIIMTICLFAYIAAFYIGFKITDIKV